MPRSAGRPASPLSPRRSSRQRRTLIVIKRRDRSRPPLAETICRSPRRRARPLPVDRDRGPARPRLRAAWAENRRRFTDRAADSGPDRAATAGASSPEIGRAMGGTGVIDDFLRDLHPVHRFRLRPGAGRCALARQRSSSPSTSRSPAFSGPWRRTRTCSLG